MSKDEASREIIDFMYRFSNPEMLKSKLIFTSMFVVVFERFKDWIVSCGFDENGQDTFKDYGPKVLSREKVVKIGRFGRL